jgi:hypothetical protein
MAREILEKCDFFLRWRLVAFGQIPGVQCFLPVEIHVDDTAAHQVDERPVGVSALQNGNLSIDSSQHQQQQLSHEGLASTALRHDQHVGVAESRIKRRERHHLPRRRLKENDGITQALPGEFNRQQVCRVQREALLLALRLLRHPRKRPDEDPLLRERLGDTSRAVHSRDGMENPLAAIRQYPFRFLSILWNCGSGATFAVLRSR